MLQASAAAHTITSAPEQTKQQAHELSDHELPGFDSAMLIYVLTESREHKRIRAERESAAEEWKAVPQGSW